VLAGFEAQTAVSYRCGDGVPLDVTSFTKENHTMTNDPINTTAGTTTAHNLSGTSDGAWAGETGAVGSRDNSGLLTGLFRDRESAEMAYRSATERGYDHKDLNLVMSDETRARHFSGANSTETELGTKAAEGAGIGGAIGGTLGAIAAAIAAVGTSIVLPGLGLVVAGPIVAALAGAGAGGATGGLLGALIGWGIPEERVKHYEAGIKDGGILMGIKPRSDEDARYLADQWKTSRGEHVYL
jgi:hypothetical protein